MHNCLFTKIVRQEAYSFTGWKMSKKATHNLYAVDLFSDLEAEQIAAISALCEWQQLDKEKIVVSQADPTNAVFFIVMGCVVIKSFSTEGKEVTYSEIPAGQIFGEFSAIDGQPRSAFVQTSSDSLIASMTSKQFRDLIHTTPALGLKLCEHLIAKNRRLTERIYEYSTMTVRHRICAELLRLVDIADADAHTVTINPAPSHYQLSTRLSTHREAVSREFSQLAARGIIKTGRQKLTVTDVPALRKLVLSEI